MGQGLCRRLHESVEPTPPARKRCTIEASQDRSSLGAGAAQISEALWKMMSTFLSCNEHGKLARVNRYMYTLMQSPLSWTPNWSLAIRTTNVLLRQEIPRTTSGLELEGRFTTPAVWDALMELVATCPRLQRLSLCGDHIGNAEKPTMFPHVSTLNLCLANHLSHTVQLDSMVHHTFPNLRRLTLAGAYPGVFELLPLHQLHELRLMAYYDRTWTGPLYMLDDPTKCPLLTVLHVNGICYHMEELLGLMINGWGGYQSCPRAGSFHVAPLACK